MCPQEILSKGLDTIGFGHWFLRLPHTNQQVTYIFRWSIINFLGQCYFMTYLGPNPPIESSQLLLPNSQLYFAYLTSLMNYPMPSFKQRY